EVESARDVALLVLLGDPEVDVEQEELAVGCRLGPPAGQNLAEPLDVDEPVVSGELVDRQARVGRPRPEAVLVDAGGVDPEPAEPRDEAPGVVESLAVDRDLSSGHDPLAGQLPLDLRRVQAVEPGRRKGDGARDVPAASVVPDAPAVIG